MSFERIYKFDTKTGTRTISYDFYNDETICGTGTTKEDALLCFNEKMKIYMRTKLHCSCFEYPYKGIVSCYCGFNSSIGVNSKQLEKICSMCDFFLCNPNL